MRGKVEGMGRSGKNWESGGLWWVFLCALFYSHALPYKDQMEKFSKSGVLSLKNGKKWGSSGGKTSKK